MTLAAALGLCPGAVWAAELEAGAGTDAEMDAEMDAQVDVAQIEAPPGASLGSVELPRHPVWPMPELAGSSATLDAVARTWPAERGVHPTPVAGSVAGPVAGSDGTLHAREGQGWIAGGVVGVLGGVALATKAYAELEPASLSVQSLRHESAIDPALGVGASSLLMGYAALRLGLHRRGSERDAPLRFHPQVSVNFEGYSVGFTIRF